MDAPVEAEVRPPEGSIGGTAHTLLELLSTRVELFGVEAREEARHVQGMLLRTVIAALLAGSAAVMAGVFVILVFWDTHRLLAAGGVTLVYAVAAFVLVRGIQSTLQARPAAFAATVGEFDADLAALRGRAGEAQ